MKKIFLSLLLFAGLSVGLQAQSMYGDAAKADVKMKYVYSFEEAMKLSRQENKPVFINWFADWAVPCHGMNKYVFSDQKFADWMDKNFINLWVNAVAPENEAWVKKYDAHKLAQFTVLDKNGNMIFRIIGGRQLPEFQDLLALSLDPKTTMQGMDARYEKGERNLKFLRTYIDILRMSDQFEKSEQVMTEYFSLVKEKDLPKSENWKYITYQARNSQDPLFKKIMENKTAFVKNMGQRTIDDFLSSTYFAELFPYASSMKPYDASKIADIYMDLMQSELPDTNAVFGLYEMTKYRGEKNYPKLIESMRKHLDGEFSEWAMNLDVTLGDLKGLPNADRDIIVAYLTERSANLQRPPLSYYELAIRNLENREGIQFADLSYEESLKKAAAEGKRVFIDCYTTWCGPCKSMNAQVFPDKRLGDYFRTHFVALKMDMEKGEGVELGKKFDISAYPTLLVLEPDGTVVTRIVGARGVEKLLGELKEVEKK